MQWLGHQDTQNNWYWLLSKDMSAVSPGSASILAGYYNPPPLKALKTLILGHTEFVPLNPARVRQATGQPNAVMLTSNVLQDAFREYLETCSFPDYKT